MGNGNHMARPKLCFSSCRLIKGGHKYFPLMFGSVFRGTLPPHAHAFLCSPQWLFNEFIRIHTGPLSLRNWSLFSSSQRESACSLLSIARQQKAQTQKFCSFSASILQYEPLNSTLVSFICCGTWDNLGGLIFAAKPNGMFEETSLKPKCACLILSHGHPVIPKGKDATAEWIDAFYVSPFSSFLMTNKKYVGSAREWFTLDFVHIQQDNKETAIFTAPSISGPAEYSFHCQLVGTSDHYGATLTPSNAAAKEWQVVISEFQVSTQCSFRGNSNSY